MLRKKESLSEKYATKAYELFEMEGGVLRNGTISI